MFLCFSPCSPCPSPRIDRSSESPSSSNHANVKQDSTVPFKIQPQRSLGSSHEKLNIVATPPPSSPIPTTSLQLETQISNEAIPQLNVIPSSPLMSSQNAITSYESAIDNIEKRLKVLKNKNSEYAVGEEIEDKVSIKDDNLKANILKTNEIETSDEETGSPIRTEKDVKAAKAPVIMKLEHIDHQTVSGVNMNLLPSTQQFPVVTRRFRQLPNKFPKEDDIKEAPEPAQKVLNAQSTIDADPDLKCENSETPQTKSFTDDVVDNCEPQAIGPLQHDISDTLLSNRSEQ